jgi:predicted exporter
MRASLESAPGAPRWSIVLWLLGVLCAGVVVARSHFVADMSAFLPRHPSAQQQLLVDQLTRGALSRTLLLGIDEESADGRARLSRRLARSMRDSAEFELVANGEATERKAEAELYFRYRYLISPGVTADKFTVDGLHRAIASSVDDLSSSLGGALKDLFPRDPTGETLAMLGDLDEAKRPREFDGVWMSRDGTRAILVAVSRADGADTDTQERLLQQIRGAFAAAAQDSHLPQARLQISGSAIFAVDARNTIKREVTRLSLIGMAGMMALLLLAFRSLAVLGLCLLPVLSGALLGTAAVSVVFGSVHGITIGFGSTLIGEAVDYSIYFLMQSQSGRAAGGRSDESAIRRWLEEFWPTIRLGMLTSVCGYCALVFSGFPGLAQLGTYSIAGLLAAALVTRFVLPGFSLRRRLDTSSERELAVLARGVALLRRLPRIAWLVSAGALVFLVARHNVIWNPALSGLSPVSLKSQQLDESLRADLGAPQMRFLVVVQADSEQAALRAAEEASTRLRALQARQLIEGFESPSKLVPSLFSQHERQQALPGPAELKRRLAQALQGLPIRLERLQPFLDDVEAARTSAPLTRAQLGQSEVALSFDTMFMQDARGVTTFLPVRQGPDGGEGHAPIAPTKIDAIGAALQELAQDAQDSVRAKGDARSRVEFIDMAEESVHIYARYFNEILVLAGFGVLAIVLLLAYALKDRRRVVAVLTPLGLAVLLVMAGLVALGEHLNLLHLVGLFLIVAVGSNYALFFNKPSPGPAEEERAMELGTLKSLLVANASTTIGFGVLAFSTVPVLHALGVTVAPGAVLALCLSVTYAVRLRVANASHS